MYANGRKQKDIGLTRYPSLATCVWLLGERKGDFFSSFEWSVKTTQPEKLKGLIVTTPDLGNATCMSQVTLKYSVTSAATARQSCRIYFQIPGT